MTAFLAGVLVLLLGAAGVVAACWPPLPQPTHPVAPAPAGGDLTQEIPRPATGDATLEMAMPEASRG